MDPSSNDDRIAHLNRLLPHLQKARSNTLEACGGDELLAASVAPWTWGEHALLPRLVAAIESGWIDESGYRGMVWIVQHHMPDAAWLDSLHDITGRRSDDGEHAQRRADYRPGPQPSVGG